VTVFQFWFILVYFRHIVTEEILLIKLWC